MPKAAKPVWYYVEPFHEPRVAHIFTHTPKQWDQALCGWKRPMACFVFKGRAPSPDCETCKTLKEKQDQPADAVGQGEG